MSLENVQGVLTTVGQPGLSLRDIAVKIELPEIMDPQKINLIVNLKQDIHDNKFSNSLIGGTGVPL